MLWGIVFREHIFELSLTEFFFACCHLRPLNATIQKKKYTLSNIQHPEAPTEIWFQSKEWIFENVPGLKVIKQFLCSTQLSMLFFLLILY